jgi:hypothetical protein
MKRRLVVRSAGVLVAGLAGCAGAEFQGAAGREGSSESDTEVVDFPRFRSYTGERATIRFDPTSFPTPETRVRIAVFTRRYPVGEVLARGLSPPIPTGDTDAVHVTIPLGPVREGATGFAQHVAELHPAGRNPAEPVPGTGRTIAETDRFFRQTDGAISPAPHPNALSRLDRTDFRRIPKAGCYHVIISGPTPDPLRVRVFKSEYVRATTRPRTRRYRAVVRAALDTGLAARVARQIASTARPNGDGIPADLTAAIRAVQALGYVSEPVEAAAEETIKFPAETLVEGGGDCEDTAVLLAAILRASPLERQCAVIHPPNHAGVGVAGEDFSGTYYVRNGTRYFYVETTGSGWDVGELPAQYAESTARVHPV